MGDWSFAVFDELLFLTVVLVGLLFLHIVLKGRSVRRLIKVLFIAGVLCAVYAIVAHKISNEERDRSRESRIEQRA